jgi:hypothetical protein
VSAMVDTPEGPLIAVAGRDGAAVWACIVRATDWEVTRPHRVKYARCHRLSRL